MFYMKLASDLNALTQGALTFLCRSFQSFPLNLEGWCSQELSRTVTERAVLLLHDTPTRGNSRAVKMVMATGLESYHVGCRLQNLLVALHLLIEEPHLSARKGSLLKFCGALLEIFFGENLFLGPFKSQQAGNPQFLVSNANIIVT